MLHPTVGGGTAIEVLSRGVLLLGLLPYAIARGLH